MKTPEMEAESTSNVPMLAAGGTFIPGTADTTVTEVRHSTKRHRACENVSEDLLNRHIQDYGLFCPERAKNLVWCFFQKYGSKNLKSVEDNLKFSQQTLCTICLEIQFHEKIQVYYKFHSENNVFENGKKKRQPSEKTTRKPMSWLGKIRSHRLLVFDRHFSPRLWALRSRRWRRSRSSTQGVRDTLPSPI